MYMHLICVGYAVGLVTLLYGVLNYVLGSYPQCSVGHLGVEYHV